MPVQQGVREEIYPYRYIYDSEVWHSTALAVLQTALDITGRGKATILRAAPTGNDNHGFRITVDGNITINDRNLASITSSQFIVDIIDFNTSLRVEHRNGAGAINVRVSISYCVN